MKNSHSIAKAITLAAGLASIAGAASAATVQYTYTGESYGGLVMGIKTADYNGNARVGEFIMTSSTPGFATPLLTYCTDVGAFLSTTFNYTPTPLSSATGVSPAWLPGGIQNVATLWGNDKNDTSTAIQTAGLQLAIWEMLYTGPLGTYTTSSFYNQNNAAFHLTSDDQNSLAAAAYAAQLLDGFSSLTPDANVEWMAPTEPNGTIQGSQGLLYETAGPTGGPVPDATSTLGLLGLSFVGLAAAGRKLSAAKA